MWHARLWWLFRHAAALAGGVYLARFMFASVNSGLWHPGLAITFQLGVVLIVPIALVMASLVARWLQGRSPHVSDIVSGAVVLLGLVMVATATEGLRDWYSLRYWRGNAEVWLSIAEDYAERYQAAAGFQEAFDKRLALQFGSTGEWMYSIGPRPHAFVPGRPPDRAIWGVQLVRRRTGFTPSDAMMRAAVVGTLVAAWIDVPITLSWPPAMVGREWMHTVTMTEVWARHQQADGSYGWTLLDAEVAFERRD